MSATSNTNDTSTGGKSVRVPGPTSGTTTNASPQHTSYTGGASELETPIENMSKHSRHLYVYACKMVKLIQSKTPLIVYYSPLARACLMNDGRRGQKASFECHFYNGGRVARMGVGMLPATSSCSPALTPPHTQRIHQCHISGLVVTCGGQGGWGEGEAEEMLLHGYACLEHCSRAAASLFEGGGGGGVSSGYGAQECHESHPAACFLLLGCLASAPTAAAAAQG